ncbi:MAG: hypothetical protein EOO63_03135 [Hymenobacter sp.]|nr:MAG: hypothetical protein EOO63_03135 [Hymenobacter sp.]
MLALKRIVTVAVMVYLLLALLFLLFPAVRSSVAGLGGSGSVVDDERNFFYVLSVIGAVMLALQLVVENLDSSLLRREVGKQDGKINELKAKLYDTHQPATSATPGASAASHQPSVSYPTAASAAAAAEREPHPTNPPATPPTY